MNLELGFNRIKHNVAEVTINTTKLPDIFVYFERPHDEP